MRFLRVLFLSYFSPPHSLLYSLSPLGYTTILLLSILGLVQTPPPSLNNSLCSPLNPGILLSSSISLLSTGSAQSGCVLNGLSHLTMKRNVNYVPPSRPLLRL